MEYIEFLWGIALSVLSLDLVKWDRGARLRKSEITSKKCKAFPIQYA